MTRTLNYTKGEAFHTAVSLFDTRFHSTIKIVGPQNGARKAIIMPASNYAGKLRGMARRGEIPAELPGYMVIDGDGKPVAVCHYCEAKP